MPLTTSMIGHTGPAAVDELDDRWVMNYAASVFDPNPVYFDNLADRRLPAHPAYISHLEWDAIGGLRLDEVDALTPDERLRGVHSANSTVLHRTPESGATLSATATVVGVEQRRAGGRLTVQIDTVDHSGLPVATSLTAMTFLGVSADGDVPPPQPVIATPPLSDAAPVRTEDIDINRFAPYVFSECARDYGIIHTDPRVAAEAGFPGLILHGTGTIAYALSALTNTEAGGDPRRIRGFAARLTGMVMCPSTMTLRVLSVDHGCIRFDVVSNGSTVVADGAVMIEDAR